jgi:DNA-binding NarL/FixJ family response regulator
VADSLSWDAEWVVDHRADLHGQLGIQAMRAIDAALAHSPDAGRRAQVKFRLAGFLAWGPGDLEEAERYSREAVELFEAAGDRSKTMLATNQLAYVRWIGGDYPAFEEASRRLLQEAEAAGDQFLALQALNAIGFGAYFHGDFAEAEHAFERSVAIARDDGRRYRLTMSLGLLGLSLALQGRFGDAVPLLEEAKSLRPEWGDSVLPEWTLIVPWLAGDFAGTVAAAEDVLARNPLGVGRRRAAPFVFAALSALETGEMAPAARYLDVARGAYEGRPWFFWHNYCGHGEAVLAWRQGQPETAIAVLQRTAAAIHELRPFLALVLVDLAEIAADHGDVDAATEAAEGLQDVARRVDGDLCRALCAMAAALAAIARGEAAPAVAEAREAVGILSDSGYRAFLGRALDALGRALHSVDQEEAVAAFRSAATTFAACGATWRRDRALAGLADLGAAGRRATAAVLGPAALTRRERDVIRLAAEGHTAREIAERLLIGRRTVEGYLASAYAKLGVGSKVELVRRAGELGL